MKRVLLVQAATMMAFASMAQIQIDKPVQLTGSGSDGKVTGIQQVTNPTDAASKAYVDAQIAGVSGGSNMNYTFTCNKSAQNIPAGGSTAYDAATLTCSYTSGDASAIALKITGAPSGVTWNMTPGGGFPSFTSTLIFYCTSGTTPGTYPITVTAQGGVANQTVSISLTVQAVKRIFVTSTTYTGNLGGFSGADAICQTRASAASLSGTWKAWLSTGTLNAPAVTAASRVNQFNGPFVRVDYSNIATSWTDLTDGSLMNAISMDEFGAAATPTEVWTNTRKGGSSGTESNVTLRDCNAWTNGTSGSTGYFGVNNSVTAEWTDSYYENCNSPNKLYCFEQ